MVYAVLGIPLMLVYLSSVGSLLSRCVRGALSRAFCCCLCANCGYCCYDEKRMQERERRLKKKRQQLEIQQQQQQQMQLQEPFYVRSASTVTGFSASASSTHNNLHSPVRDGDLLKLHADPEYGAAATAAGAGAGAGGGDGAGAEGGRGCGRSRAATAGGLALPVALCLALMLLYVCLGAAALVKLEKWTFLEGCYFCFMSLSTIGFGDLVPGGPAAKTRNLFSSGSNGTVWFCSAYILTGMALTAMCFNILHDEIVHRLKHQAAQLGPEKDAKAGATFLEEAAAGADPYATAAS
ncbi:hypothetical protein R5R35_012661 [Gryllus longicercus]|uniref:Potassium channel domain-containing protein n=1 Tax=Gryllus longicercus TaxID=2509291 RepID=A0AAN9V5A2_9ORTH